MCGRTGALGVIVHRVVDQVEVHEDGQLQSMAMEKGKSAWGIWKNMLNVTKKIVLLKVK